MLKLLTTISILIFYADTSMAYNSSKCDNWIVRNGGGGNIGGLLVSSTSFTSSTGNCSMLGKIEDQSIRYIASNYDLMLINSAQGKGEYLSAYLNLSTCSSNNLSLFEGLMKKNIKTIYGDQLDNQPEQVYKNINILIKNDTNFQNKCEIIES